ncbi:MAG: hypothetical protein M3O70_20760 [Actinomycetota bacterium]|nr:hypothetical protein [Actinomycetota bacterium]
MSASASWRPRGATAIALLTFLAVTAPAPAWAHGIGVRGDLPLPLWMVSYGAAMVLVLSFVALRTLWPSPRLEGNTAGVAVAEPVERAAAGLEWCLRLVGLVAFATVWAAALVGPLSPVGNLAPYAIYVTFWVGGLVVSGLVADVWYALSPFETVARLAGPTTDEEPSLLNRIGVWPAAVLLLVFAWLELVYPNPADPRTLAQAIGVYVAIIAIGAAWWGRAWIRSAEAFGVVFSIVAAMAPIHRGDTGRLRLRPPLAGLADLDVVPGTAAVILIALGTTTFDGVTRQAFWEELTGSRTGWALVPYSTAGLLLTVAAVAGLYVWAMHEAARRTERNTAELVEAFVHSLVPIALAYAIAHYFSLLVFEGQRFVELASDPLGRGWDLFGTAHWQVNYTAVSTAVIAWVQAGAIVAGHLAGVVLAHDRAVVMFPGKLATTSQYALLAAMVSYTVGGLALLLGG